ncbi:MAG: hypothetical protein VX378_13170, partial [Pseudomonadota bacterium]|nr:hypothetical protein [Pseudomonadota bacterium]
LGKVSSPKVDTLQKIAEVLEVPIGALMNEEGHSELESQLLLAFQALTDDQKALLVLTAQAWTSEKNWLK